MSKQIIGVGTVANDGTGDTIRAAMNKVNANFTEIYNAVGDGNTIAAAFPDFTTLTSNNLLYVNSEGTVDSLPGVSYESDGRIRVETSTTSLIPDFQIISSNNAIVSILEYSDVPTNTAAIGLYKRRGTVDSPTDAQPGDVIGVVSVLGKGSATTSRLSWHVSSTTLTSGTTDSNFKLATTVNGQQVLPIQTNEDGSVRISDAYNFPLTDGTSGQLLSTDGSGSIQWIDAISKTQLKQVVADSVDFADFQARIAAL